MKCHNVLARIKMLDKKAEGKFEKEAQKALAHLNREITEMIISMETFYLPPT